MANFISIFRIFVAFFAIYLLFIPTTWAYILAFILTVIAFSLDGVDGYIARKFNESSKLGSVIDIMGDRIVEASYWIIFAVMGWLSPIFPIICVARAFTTDSLRSVALAQGYTAFGDTSMQSSKIGKFICASKFMRISYAVAKVVAFILIIVAHTPGFELYSAFDIMNTIAVIFAWIAIIFCVVRGLPVVLESKKLFEKNV